MNEFITKLKSMKGLPIILLAALVGIVLIIIGSLNEADKNQKTQEKDITVMDGENSDEYAKSLESRLEELISKINGAGKVSVMVTLKSSGEYQYAQDKIGSGSEYVINEGSPVLLRLDYPGIAGIAVISENKNISESLKLELINMLSALLGISSNRIYVC